MSSFILSDKHFSIISIYLAHINHNIDIQELANKLKSINIKSVNHRYKENTRITKCKIINDYHEYRYNKYDIIKLIQCWGYQSCENGLSLDYNMMDAFLLSHFEDEHISEVNDYSNLWSI
jgi:hypothetical protein